MAANRQPDLEVTNSVRIPRDEIRLTYARSSGPGGQNVNKVNTKVQLAFDAMNSPSLSDGHKQRLRERIPERLGRDGVIRLSSQRHRTQLANRQAVVNRLVELLADALRPRTVRKATRPPRSVAKRRVEDKRKHGARKSERKWRPD